jgi:hypothetical protein
MTSLRLTLTRLGTGAVLAMTALSVWACSEQTLPTSPSSPLKPQATTPAFNVINPTAATASLCAEGPAGTYNYNISLDIPAGYTVGAISGTYTAGQLTTVASPAFETITVGSVSLASGVCQTIGTILQSLNFPLPADPSIIVDPLRFLTITQTSGPAGTKLDNIVTTEQGNPDVTAAAPPPTAVISINFYHGAVASFWNSLIPPPPGNQGCTPGYWKNAHHFDSWKIYTPGQSIGSVFTVPVSYAINGVPEANFTLDEGLSFQGGPDLSGKAQILLRAAIAALLNSKAVNYPMTTAAIIKAVNDAIASNDETTITDLATKLDGFNNGLGGCPLN